MLCPIEPTSLLHIIAERTENILISEALAIEYLQLTLSDHGACALDAVNVLGTELRMFTSRPWKAHLEKWRTPLSHVPKSCSAVRDTWMLTLGQIHANPGFLIAYCVFCP